MPVDGNANAFEPSTVTSEMIKREQLTTGRSSVSFVTEQKGGALIGSGTLARVGEVVGVVTCSHVLHRLGSSEHFGLCTFPIQSDRPQRWKVARSLTQEVLLGEAPWETSTGPDIAFLRLPESDMRRMLAVANVIDLERHCRLELDGDSTSLSVDLVIGAVGEWTKVEGQLVKISSLINAGRVVESGGSHGFDLLTLLPMPDDVTPMPDRFGGTSGGGLWRLHFRRVGKSELVFDRRRFRGVAFYETAPQPDTHRRSIICHGPTSLFEKLVPQIASLQK